MTQDVALRTWPAAAVHDTVAAVLRGPAFQRDLGTTLLGRAIRWLGDGIDWLAVMLHGVPGGRSAVTWIIAALGALVVARLLFAAHARNADAPGSAASRRGGRGRDPWRAADALAAAGDHIGAAHALYRGVLAGLAQRERLRLHPSMTSGDYARELRARRSGADAGFRAFARRYDDAVYGHEIADAALTADLRRLAEPFRDAVRAA